MNADDAAFPAEIADINRRRLRALVPVMVVVHLLHVAFFYVRPSVRATLGPDVARWRDWLTLAHGVMVPLTLLGSLLLFRVTAVRYARFFGPVISGVYLLHGAWVSSIDQIVSSNISAYIGYSLGAAAVVCLVPRIAAGLYLAGGAALLAGLFSFQRVAAARLTNLPTLATLTICAFACSWYFYRSRRREFGQRRTIDRQRAELEALNASLEQRVADQVQEIVARAAEVERLNSQLQEKVRERSKELSLALARLAEQHVAVESTLPAGTVLGGRFAIERVIGQGGMGTVYAGRDTSTRGTVAVAVAIKVIQASSSRQLDAMRRFIREAAMAATVTHPAIVRTLHVDVSDDGRLYQVQELIDGKSLSSFGRSAWAPADVARVMALLCDALAAAHAQGIVHRDIKPDNIMLTTAPPGLKLLDFGIAKLHFGHSDTDPATVARLVIGTPGYMAPEQSIPDGVLSDRTDLFAVGVMLSRLVRPPIPPPLAALIERCRADEPTARPSAAEAAVELRRVADAASARSVEEIVRTIVADESPGESSAAQTAGASPRRRES